MVEKAQQERGEGEEGQKGEEGGSEWGWLKATTYNMSNVMRHMAHLTSNVSQMLLFFLYFFSKGWS